MKFKFLLFLCCFSIQVNGEEFNDYIAPENKGGIRYSFPTIYGTLPKTTNQTKEFEIEKHQIQEDTWRQLELYPASQKNVIVDRLKKIKLHFLKSKVNNAWAFKTLYVRGEEKSPLISEDIKISEIEKTINKLPSPLYLESGFNLERIENSFIFKLDHHMSLYGYTYNNKVQVLAFSGDQASQEVLKHMKNLISKYNLILVDWVAAEIIDL